MAYAAYGSFADLLRQAKTQSQLRGTPLSSSAVKSMGSGYFADAADAANTERSYDLANASQSLAEKAQAASEDQFAKNYALSNSQFAENLSQAKAEAAAQEDAAKKAETQGYLGTGAQALGTAAMLTKGSLWGKAATPANSLLTQSGTGSTSVGIGAADLPGAATGEAANAAASNTLTGTIGKVAPVAAYIAAAELARGQWGGQGIDYGSKTKQQRTVDSPGTAGVMASVLPGSLVAPDDTVLGNANKNMSALERTAMAPIDYLFGDSNAFNGETLRTAGNALYAPISGDSGAASVANAVLNPISLITGGRGTWICTEVNTSVGLTKEDRSLLKKLRRYTVKNHKKFMVAYWDKGKNLIEVINSTEDKVPFYGKLKSEMIKPILKLTKENKMEEAFEKYRDDTFDLMEKYTPEIFKELKEVLK